MVTNRDTSKKIPKFALTSRAVEVLDPRSEISGPTLRRASACQNVHE